MICQNVLRHEFLSTNLQFSGKISHTHKLKYNVQSEKYHERDTHRALWSFGQEGGVVGEGLETFGDDKIGLSSSIKCIFK